MCTVEISYCCIVFLQHHDVPGMYLATTVMFLYKSVAKCVQVSRMVLFKCSV